MSCSVVETHFSFHFLCVSASVILVIILELSSLIAIGVGQSF